MKKVKKVIDIVLLFFICFSFKNIVLAKEAENICQYQGKLDGNELIVKCEFYADNSKPNCTFGSLEVDQNSETFSNWGKIYNGDGKGEAGVWYSKNRKCIPYIVFIDKESGVDSYELTGHGTRESANIYLADRKKFYDKALIVTWNRLNDTVEDEINGYISTLNNIGKNYNLDKFCSKKDGKYLVSSNSSNKDMCAASIESLYDNINTWDNNIKKWISKNELSSDSEIIVKYEEARKKARNQIHEAWDKGEIENPSDDPVTGDHDDENDPGYNSSSGTCISCGNDSLKNIPEQLPMFIRNIIIVIQSLVPVIIIGLGIYDFTKAVISSDEKGMKESQNRFIRRIIAGVLVFFVVAIVRFVFGLIPGDSALSCVACFVTDSSSCSEPYICNTEEFDVEINTDGSSSNSSSTVNCDAYASRGECSRPEAKNKGCSWDSTTNKCILKNSNNNN